MRSAPLRHSVPGLKLNLDVLEYRDTDAAVRLVRIPGMLPRNPVRSTYVLTPRALLEHYRLTVGVRSKEDFVVLVGKLKLKSLVSTA